MSTTLLEAPPAEQPTATPPAEPGVVPPVTTPADPAASADSVVPEKYELALPKDSTLDPAIVERTAAIARSLGLSNAAGQQLLDSLAKEVTDTTTAAQAATTKAVEDAKAAWQAEQVEANKPGGEAWTKRETDWRAETLAKYDGDEAKLAVANEKAQQAIEKYGNAEIRKFLQDTALGSHPVVIGFLAKIGKAMSEGTFVHGAAARADKPKSPEVLFYGEDGMGPKQPVSTA